MGWGMSLQNFYCYYPVFIFILFTTGWLTRDWPVERLIFIDTKIEENIEKSPNFNQEENTKKPAISNKSDGRVASEETFIKNLSNENWEKIKSENNFLFLQFGRFLCSCASDENEHDHRSTKDRGEISTTKFYLLSCVSRKSGAKANWWGWGKQNLSISRAPKQHSNKHLKKLLILFQFINYLWNSK